MRKCVDDATIQNVHAQALADRFAAYQLPERSAAQMKKLLSYLPFPCHY